MNQAAGENTLSCPVTEVNEHTSRFVERVVPTRLVLIPVVLSNPFEDLEDRLEVKLAIGEALCLQPLVIPFSRTLSLAKGTREVGSQAIEDGLLGTKLVPVVFGETRLECYELVGVLIRDAQVLVDVWVSHDCCLEFCDLSVCINVL